jgi:regulator of protease activity HflC (stomatin/prohibitin superfamily)
MTRSNAGKFGDSDDETMPGRRGVPGGSFGMLPSLLMLIVAALVVYLAYFWFVRRVSVDSGHVLVVMKKYGGRSLDGDQVVIPRPPNQKSEPAGYAEWEKKYRDVNGIMEQVYLPGVYFGFSPFDYERTTVGMVEVKPGKVGIAIRKFGEPLPPGQVVAEGPNQRGPLPVVLQPGKYPEYSNPYAYDVKHIDPVQVDPGHRGVVTVMAGKQAQAPNQYLVNDGEQGVQRQTEPEGFRYVNPYLKRITPISIQSQRFEMVGADAIRFPSADSFDIRMEGFVEWSVIPEKLPLIYTQYGEGGELIPYLDERVILPYARSFSRLVGSQYTARDFISGDTKLKFQAEFEDKLREACAKQGIEVLQALVRDIIPPDEIKNPINEREIAKQQIRSLEQQIQVAKSQADLARQTEMASQNQRIGEANKQVVTIIKRAEQDRDVAITKAKQDLEVAKLQLEAAQKQGDAIVARGQAEANVILLQRQAEAEPLRQQISAFGDGQNYAQYFFNQKIAPSVKSIMTNTDGPFAEMFRQFTQPQEPRAKPAGAKLTDAEEPVR